MISTVGKAIDQAPRASRLLRSARKSLEIPGIALAIVQGPDETITTSGSPRIGSSRKISKRTLFHMASVTKPMTAMAAMILAEEGRINLDLPVTAYLPLFRVVGGQENSITIKHLLSHHAGLPDVVNFDLEKHEFDEGALGRQVGSACEVVLNTPPGEKYSYSDFGYETIGHIIAVVSGMSFEDFVAKRLLEPAGMTKSSLCFADLDSRFLASAHIARNGAIQPTGYFPYNRRHGPSSTLCSCAEDMARWIRFCDAIDAGERTEVLSATAYREARAVSAPTKGVFWTEVGHGFFLGRAGNLSYYGHEGSDAGFRAMLVMVPESRGGLALISNMDGDNLKPVVSKILLRCFGRH